ncbi:MAG: hypothetical protein ACLRH0_09505 [Blautia wexlerae]
MKFYSEKLSPRRLSLQWRLTLLISGLVITACALMYFFISRSAVTGLEGISDYVVLVTPDNSNPISINVDPKILIPDLENQIQNTKNNFLFQSMIATGIIILLSSICTWFVTRRALTPCADSATGSARYRHRICLNRWKSHSQRMKSHV